MTSVEKQREANRRSYARHKEARQKAIREWQARNPEKVRSARLLRYAKHRELLSAKAKEKQQKFRKQQPQYYNTYHKTRKDTYLTLLTQIKSIPCTDCGNSFSPCCMDFDHVRGTKLFCLGNVTGGHSLASIQAEMAKCDVVCACCHRIRTQVRRKPGSYLLKRRQWFNAVKSGSCADCGYSFHPAAMDFDHISGEKKMGLAQMLGWSKKKILVEMAKCVLVCACCHRLRTEQRRQGASTCLPIQMQLNQMLLKPRHGSIVMSSRSISA